MKNPLLNYNNYWLNSYSKYNIPPKALPLLVCTKNTALGDVSRDLYSTRLCLVLYLFLDTPSHAVFSIQTRGSALSNIWKGMFTSSVIIMKNAHGSYITFFECVYVNSKFLVHNSLLLVHNSILLVFMHYISIHIRTIFIITNKW